MTGKIHSSLRTLGDLLVRPPFFARQAFQIDLLAAETLLELSRLPHRYGFAFRSLGSGPHLLDFEATGAFDTVMRGDGFDHSDAAAAATRSVFETMERVWSTSGQDNDLVFGSYNELGDAAVDPRSFALLSAEELASSAGARFVPYRPDQRLAWTTAYKVSRDRRLSENLMPALFVFTGFGARYPEQRLAPMLSTGLAAAVRYDDALLAAVCEVIERDAFIVAWLFGQPPPRIANGTDLLAPSAALSAAMLAGDGFEVEFYDLTRDIAVPVVLASIQDATCGPEATVLGLGCHPSGSEAIAKSLREAMTLMVNKYEFTAGGDVVRRQQYGDRPELQRGGLDAFLSSSRTSERPWMSSEKLGADLQMPSLLLRTIDLVAAADKELYFCDLTPKSGEEQCRFALVRAVIPGLQPHLYELDCWRLESPRLREVGRQLGLTNGTVTRDMINQEPNPFAKDASRDLAARSPP